MDPPTYHSKTGGRRYRFPTSPDRPSSADSSRILSESPTSSNAQLPSQTVYSDVAFPHAKPHTSHSFSNGSTRYVHRPSSDHRHSAPDQGARPSSSPHYVSEHPKRLSSLGIRRGIESRRASLPSPPTTLHHPRGSRFWRTVLNDNPNMDRPRFLSSARRSASVMDRDPTDLSHHPHLIRHPLAREARNLVQHYYPLPIAQIHIGLHTQGLYRRLGRFSMFIQFPNHILLFLLLFSLLSSCLADITS